MRTVMPSENTLVAEQICGHNVTLGGRDVRPRPTAERDWHILLPRNRDVDVHVGSR
ncbi:hypothetical protein HN371_14410 [Candidatus Poribacteria bacterium]|jgi:hypothetical protein|nr:hypothetical protein [Candidatus Poribacteria bacterium]MBT5536007.1 hypothetical protein [Candidatus Poribacteria bacterium]MBT5713807.1 hypothetical protein [Candidatus Poribacteria bacterium]MBT7806503.1 hypothetical protein [Candidatus Poribacteria bacterium]